MIEHFAVEIEDRLGKGEGQVWSLATWTLGSGELRYLMVRKSLGGSWQDILEFNDNMIHTL